MSENSNLKFSNLPFKNIPHQSPLFLDFQSDEENIKKFYPEKNTDYKSFAEKVLTNYSVDRERLCDCLLKINSSFGAENKTLGNIELLREKDCVAIVTGQQAGLFSGAVYTIYKALSAIKFAETLRRQNINAVPIFWIAEEDHDFDEVKKTFIPDANGKLAEIENTPRHYKENSPVGLIELDETIGETVGKLFELLPRTEFSEATKDLIAQTYKKGETYSTAFAKFLTKLFSKYGLIILPPLDKDLKKLCAPIFSQAIEKSDEIVDALLEKNVELESENYAAQVLVTNESFPFFYKNENGERLPLRKDLQNGRIKVQDSKTEFDNNDLIEIARRNPERLSPNALMRPVVQDYLLPTLAYFGGAAEIAYFAQNSAIYKILNRPVTPIYHRAGLTIIERKHARALEKYNLDFIDLFDGKEEISARIVEEFLSRETARVFADVEEKINAQLNRLERRLLADEPTLADNAANRRRKILWHIGALRKKFHRAEILKNEVLKRRIETLFSALLPNGALQERTINVTVFLNGCGSNFIDWIYESLPGREDEHKILYL